MESNVVKETRVITKKNRSNYEKDLQKVKHYLYASSEWLKIAENSTIVFPIHSDRQGTIFYTIMSKDEDGSLLHHLTEKKNVVIENLLGEREVKVNYLIYYDI